MVLVWLIVCLQQYPRIYYIYFLNSVPVHHYTEVISYIIYHICMSVINISLQIWYSIYYIWTCAISTFLSGPGDHWITNRGCQDFFSGPLLFFSFIFCFTSVLTNPPIRMGQTWTPQFWLWLLFLLTFSRFVFVWVSACALVFNQFT